MGQTFTDRLRAIGSATLIVLVLTGASNAADASVCAVSANPSKFDHQSVTLEGIVTALFKETSRRHRKEMTFTLRSLAGCGSVLVYAQEPMTVSNGDHIRVDLGTDRAINHLNHTHQVQFIGTDQERRAALALAALRALRAGAVGSSAPPIRWTP